MGRAHGNPHLLAQINVTIEVLKKYRFVELRDITMIRKEPIGGFKQSGNGRECGDYAFESYLEVKALLGYAPAS
jgi:hypothetical protein